jgi:hypothetical protein
MEMFVLKSEKSVGTNRIYDDIIIDDNIVPIGGIFPETFESGSKTSYTPAVLTTGNWILTIGISTSDVKKVLNQQG